MYEISQVSRHGLVQRTALEIRQEITALMDDVMEVSNKPQLNLCDYIDDMSYILESHNPWLEMEEVSKMLFLAYKYHHQLGEQYRENGQRYITHPGQVGGVLALKECDTKTMLIGIGHDLFDMNPKKYDDIKNDISSYFGRQPGSYLIRQIISLTSEKNKDPSLKDAQIGLNVRSGIRAKTVRVVDRSLNLVTLDSLTSKRGENSEERILRILKGTISYLDMAAQVDRNDSSGYDIERFIRSYLEEDYAPLLNKHNIAFP